MKLLQNTLRTTDIGRKFFGNVAQERTVRNILKEAYGDPAAVTDELVECILKPGLQPGGGGVLDFISYSGGPLPGELLPAMPPSVPVRILWGQADPWEVAGGRAHGEFECVDKFVELPGVGHCPMDGRPTSSTRCSWSSSKTIGDAPRVLHDQWTGEEKTWRDEGRRMPFIHSSRAWFARIGSSLARWNTSASVRNRADILRDALALVSSRVGRA